MIARIAGCITQLKLMITRVVYIGSANWIWFDDWW